MIKKHIPTNKEVKKFLQEIEQHIQLNKNESRKSQEY